MGYLLRHFLHFFSCYTLQKNSEKRLRAPFWQQARQSNYRGQQKAYSCTRGPNKSASIISITVFFCMSFVITASPNTQSKWLTFCNRELQNAEILSRCFFFSLEKMSFSVKADLLSVKMSVFQELESLSAEKTFHFILFMR